MIFINWLMAALSKLFTSRLGMWIASAMAFFGLEWATNEVVLDPIVDQIRALMSSTGGDAIGWLAFFNVDRYLSCIVSAYAVAAGKAVFLRRRAA